MNKRKEHRGKQQLPAIPGPQPLTFGGWFDPANFDTVIGVDASLRSTGVAILRRGVEGHQTAALKTQLRGAARLEHMLHQLLCLILGEEVDGTKLWDFSRYPEPRRVLVLIEEYAFSQTLQSHQTGEIGGMFRFGMWKLGIPFVEVPIGTVKIYCTGRGNPDWKVVLIEAYKLWGIEGTTDDEVDALILAHMGFDLIVPPEKLINVQRVRAHQKLKLLPVAHRLSKGALG